MALPDTVKLPTMSTKPGLMVITVVPPTLPRMLPPDETTVIDDVPLAIEVASRPINPAALTEPLITKLPVTFTLAAVSLVDTTALPLLLAILVTEVVVVIWRTSMISPGSGASVNVNTQVGSVPATA